MNGPEARTPRYRFPANVTGLLFPPVIWALAFALLYAVQGVGCAGSLRDIEVSGLSGLRLILGAIAMVAIAAILWAGILAYRELLRTQSQGEGTATARARFLALQALLSAVLFLVATAWSGIPIIMVDPCGDV